MIRPDQGARCAEAPGIQGLAGVGGGLSTQNAIGAKSKQPNLQNLLTPVPGVETNA